MVSAAAVFAAVCGALLKRGQKEIALLFSLAAAVLVFLCILPQIETLTSTFREWGGAFRHTGGVRSTVKSAWHRAHRAHNGGSL